MNPNCSVCGRFVSWEKGVSYVPYGTSYDMEPPDAVYMHTQCWESLTQQEQELTKSISWLGPTNTPASHPTPASRSAGEETEE